MTRRMTSTTTRALEILNVPPGTEPREIRAAFRRLAKQYHPDLNHEPGSNQRFAGIVRAYRVLQHELGLHADDVPRRACPRCGGYDELLDGLDGRRACADCLLGLTRVRRFLPAYTIETVKHVAVILLYAAAVILLIHALASRDQAAAFGALAATMVGFVTLAATCLTVRHTH